MDKDVKSHFRYGSDVVYVMTDGTVIIKKANGESVILNNDNTIENIDQFGQIKFKQDDSNHLHYNLDTKEMEGNNRVESENNNNSYIKVYDSLKGKQFRMHGKSRLVRKGDNEIFEVLPNGSKLSIN